MTAAARRGVGRPLIAALALLSGWVAIRASTWDPPFPLPSSGAMFTQAKVAAPRRAVEHKLVAASDTPDAERRGPSRYIPLRRETNALFLAAHISPEGSGAGDRMVPRGGASFRPAGLEILARARAMSGHQALFASAMSFAPGRDVTLGSRIGDPAMMTPGRGGFRLPPGREAGGPELAEGTATAPSAAVAKPGRWSGDAWLMMREGGAGPQLASVNPSSYGGNQMGAAVRYALAPGSAISPNIYARASKALVSGGEREAAAGVSVKLARNIPLRVHGEVRVTDRPGGVEVRPAAFIVTGLPRGMVGPGLEADAYLQAGYVGGEFGTAFVDGKATLEAPVIRTDNARSTIGGGAWGGAQRDASRLDIGPTASLNLSTGSTALRASVDYRIRVAGDARPGNGVAVTLAASF